MSFLAPLALFSAAILGPIIVAIYLLKLRREDKVVSSTFLWQQVVRDVEANAPWQKLRRNLLLLLQLIILLFLVLGLARPFFPTQGTTGSNLILILDRSASMGATDETPNRLEVAKELAIKLIDQLPDEGRATLIVAGDPLEMPASATKDRLELRKAIQNVALHNGGGSDLTQPLALAAALAAREDQSEVAIISDGNVKLPTDLKMPATIRYFPIGKSGKNVAISASALQANATGQTLFVQATNYDTAVTTCRMDIYLDGTLFSAYNLTIEPGQEQSVVVEVPPTAKIAEARLSAKDVLPTDDRAWATSTLGEETKIQLVGPGNHFLETALALLPGVKVTTNTTTLDQTNSQFALTILDSVMPANLPNGNLLFIAPPQSTAFFSVTGTLDFPTIKPASSDEPLLHNLSLNEINILQAVRFVPGTWARVLVESDGAPLLVAGEREGRRIAVLAFALQESDLPLNVAFPLLLSNLVSFLAPGSGAEAAQLLPSQPLALQVDPAITEVRLTRPDGQKLSSQASLLQPKPTLQIQNGQFVYAETDSLGIYTVELVKNQEIIAQHRYAVNLFAPAESALKPQKQLSVAQTSGLRLAVPNERVGKQEFWRWLAMAAFAVLILEWLVYQRAGLTYLRQQWQVRRKKA